MSGRKWQARCKNRLKGTHDVGNVVKQALTGDDEGMLAISFHSVIIVEGVAVDALSPGRSSRSALRERT